MKKPNRPPWLTDELLDQARAVGEKIGRRPGRKIIMQELCLTNYRAEQVVNVLNDNSDPTDSEERKSNSSGGGPRPRGPGLEVDETSGAKTVKLVSEQVVTVADAIARAEVDERIWEVERFKTNDWPMGYTVGKGDDRRGCQEFLHQITVWFRRKADEKIALESILDDLKTHSPIVPPIQRTRVPGGGRRALEISIMDPHLGMISHSPSSDLSWSLDECEGMFMWAIEELLERTSVHGPFEEIVFPIGNDFLHADNVYHTTTGGTAQPEMDSWHHTMKRGKELLILAVQRLSKVAPVKVVQIPGNHDRASSYAIGEILEARFWNDSNVVVNASSSPYKFWRYGVNLVGFEHGHSVASSRLAALMANEVPTLWAETLFREWHLGDQHRKGSAKPSSMEEQGVSIEYLPGLTPPNEWHRLKGFNWQKRAATAFVWGHDTGLEDRCQVNINSYTGLPMDGRGPLQPFEKEGIII